MDELMNFDELITKSLLIITFLVTLAALGGDTWNKKAKGLAKLTITGRLIAVLSFSAMLLSWYWQDTKTDEERLATDQSLSDLLYTSYSIWKGASHPTDVVRKDIVQRSCVVLDSQILTRRNHIDFKLAPSIESLAAECENSEDRSALLFHAHELIVALCRVISKSDKALFDIINCSYYEQPWEKGVVAYTADGKPAWSTE